MSVLGFSAMAQNDQSAKKAGKHEMKMHGKRGDMSAKLKDLNLTEAQRTQMKSIRENYKTQMQDLQKNESITVKEQRERRESLAKQQQAEIDKVLTAEQRSKLQQSQTAWEGKRKGMKGDRAQMATKELNLTSAQQTQMKSLNENMRSKMQAIQKNEALTKEQKREQMQSLQKQHKSDVAGILTSEQKQKMETLKSSRRSKTL